MNVEFEVCIGEQLWPSDTLVAVKIMKEEASKQEPHLALDPSFYLEMCPVLPLLFQLPPKQRGVGLCFT